MSIRYKYEAVPVPGGLIDAAKLVTDKHPEWDVVTMQDIGGETIVVHRTVYSVTEAWSPDPVRRVR